MRIFKKFWQPSAAGLLVMIGAVLGLGLHYPVASSGLFAANYFGAGVFSLGVFSVGVISVGIFPIGIISFGVCPLGLVALGIAPTALFIARGKFKKVKNH